MKTAEFFIKIHCSFVNSGLYAVAFATFLVVFSLEAVWGHKRENELPECPPDENGEIILLPKPENCSEFYQCAGGYLYTHHCQKDLYYCAEKQYCDYIDNCDYSNCELNPQKKAQHNPPASGKAHIPAAEPECPPQTDGNITFIANPDNCSSYYECDNGVPVLMDCPETLYFCTEKNICTWVWEPNCTFNCKITNRKPAVHVPRLPTAEPKCPEQVDGNITFIVNPDNCSSYYQCDNGVPVLMDCPDDLYFCIEKNICTWDWEENCTFDCQILNRETAFVGKYNTEDKTHFINHKIEVPHTKGKRVSSKKLSN
jgi:hypothetical protein